jgi:hypothetical protein
MERFFGKGSKIRQIADKVGSAITGSSLPEDTIAPRVSGVGVIPGTSFFDPVEMKYKSQVFTDAQRKKLYNKIFGTATFKSKAFIQYRFGSKSRGKGVAFKASLFADAKFQSFFDYWLDSKGDINNEKLNKLKDWVQKHVESGENSELSASKPLSYKPVKSLEEQEKQYDAQEGDEEKDYNEKIDNADEQQSVPEDEDPTKDPDHKGYIVPKGSGISEKPVLGETENKRVRTSHRQWYPDYQLGGQDILRLTDAEKLEEIRDYGLFDFVVPINQEEDNHLHLQNMIQEKRRFTNTYANPKFRPPPAPPAPNQLSPWQRQWLEGGYIPPFPMRDDTPNAVRYYEHFNNDQRKYLNTDRDGLMQGSCFDPDKAALVNAYKRGDPQLTGVPTQFSILDDVDTTKLTLQDCLLVQN